MEHQFFSSIRQNLFGGLLPQRAVDALLPIIRAWEKYGDGDKRKFAYILATAFHESDQFRTMEEYASGIAYEGREDLGNVRNGDGKRFKGRGYVQLTGRRNYSDWCTRLGKDIVAHPELVCERDIAARILVQGMMLGTFTGKKLGNYINEAQTDFLNARRVVNGTDRAQLIAGHAQKFLTAVGYLSDPTPVDIEDEMLVTTTPAPKPPEPAPQPIPVAPPTYAPKGKVVTAETAIKARKGGLIAVGGLTVALAVAGLMFFLVGG